MGRTAVVSLALFFAISAPGDTTVNFDDLPPQTVLTTQYADAGGTGQGVVFAPLPGGAGDSARPFVEAAAGQARSGSQVADINCPTCNEGLFYIPRTTATFVVKRSRVSVYVGLLGAAAPACASGSTEPTCAVVTLYAFDANGRQLTSSAPVTVTRGAGVRTLLSVSTPTREIAAFEVIARNPEDSTKPVAIDDLTFDVPPPPATPDFTLTPAAANVVLKYGGSVDDSISIGRSGGSSGPIRFDAGTLPRGLHAQFSPNPAGGSQTTLTLSADRTTPPAAESPVTFTGTPLSATAGSTSHTFSLRIRVQSACDDVVVAQDLVDALGSGCKDIHVDGGARIDLAELADNPDKFPGAAALSTDASVLKIPAGVTLEGDRSSIALGGVLYLSHNVGKTMLEAGNDTRVAGLRLHGYNFYDTKARGDGTNGILVQNVMGVLIDGNELSGWPEAGVSVGPVPNGPTTAGRIRITNNFIHHNVQCNAGYGVVVGETGYALIDRNVFDYERHDVAGGHSSPGAGYVAALNFILTSGPTCGGHYNQHFDMHGSNDPGTWVGGDAGGFMDINHNTIRGAQSYGFLGHLTRPAFDLRGTPKIQAIFADNVLVHEDEGDAIKVEGVLSLVLKARRKLIVRGNRYGVNTSQQLAAGDFDGDGTADVFQPTGTGWFFSSSGRREWRFLNASNLRLDRLALGDFNGDGKSDVFTQRGSQWLVSFGGTSPWNSLPATSSIPMKEYRFGYFDDDRKTDIFRANGSHFYFSSAGAGAWQVLNTSSKKIGELRFCDFNADGKTDVFSLANGQWSVSYGGATQWQRLNKRLSSNLGELTFGDFDGDGRCDVARTRGRNFQLSWGGSTPWHTEPSRSPVSFTGTLVANFNRDSCADILVFAEGTSLLRPSLARFRLSSCLGPFADWSMYDMR